MRGSYFMHSNKKIGHLPHGKQLKRLIICIFVLFSNKYQRVPILHTQPNAEPACGYIKSKGPDLQSSCCPCPPQLLLITVLFAIDDAGMADAVLAVGEKTVKVFPALKNANKPLIFLHFLASGEKKRKTFTTTV